MLDDTFLNDVKNAIFDVWYNIGPDCRFVRSNEEALGMCLDADRLSLYGTKEADVFFKAACKEHGYDAVFTYLEKNIQVY